MAKTATSKEHKGKTATQVKPDKEQKKHLKREADLKLKIELIQKDLQKAERKATKAHANVDALTAQLHELNEKLAHSHAPSGHQKEKQDTSEEALQIVPVPEETAHAEQESSINGSTVHKQPANGDSYEDSQAIEELHQASLPPVEGRNDINDNPTSSSPAETTEPTQQPDEQTPSPEQPEITPESNAEGDSEADQAESEHAKEHHTSHRRSSHRHTATPEAHES